MTATTLPVPQIPIWEPAAWSTTILNHHVTINRHGHVRADGTGFEAFTASWNQGATHQQVQDGRGWFPTFAEASEAVTRAVVEHQAYVERDELAERRRVTA